MIRQLRSILSFVAAACIIFTGCSTTRVSTLHSANLPSQTEIAMGRYIEEELSLPDDISRVISCSQTEDGMLNLFYEVRGEDDFRLKLATSSDNGKTWSDDPANRPAQLPDKMLISCAGMDKTGNLILQGKIMQEDHYKVYKVDSQGNMTQSPTPMLNANDEEINSFSKIIVTESGDFIVGDIFGIYQYDSATMEMKNIYQPLDFIPDMDYVSIGDTLYIGIPNAILAYSLTTGEQLDSSNDKNVIEDANSTESIGLNSRQARILAPSSDKKSLFYVDMSGIYRRVIGGSVSERIVDGEITRLNMPSLDCVGLYQLTEDSFAVLLYDFDADTYSLVSYTYSADTPITPSTELKIYSLYENRTIRQAAALFQSQNQDVRIRYTTGKTSPAVTTSDMLRTLNTELLSGNGPDLIVLDGMPIQSYIDKDILMDMSGLMQEELSQDKYLPNIMESVKQDDKLFAIPARFRPFLLLADSPIAQASDFTSLIDALIEDKNKHGADYNISSFTSPVQYHDLFATACLPAWFHEDGSFDENQFAEFLTYIKKLAPDNNEIDGLYVTGMSTTDAIDWANGTCSIVASQISCPDDYGTFDSAIIERGQGEIVPIPGQVKNVFVPVSIVGINQNTKHSDLAAQFIHTLLSQEVQERVFYDGLPVNMDTLMNVYQGKKGIWASLSNGDSYLDIFYPSDESRAYMLELFRNLENPYFSNQDLEDSILEEAELYYDGTRSLEDTVKAVAQKMEQIQAEQIQLESD